MGWNGNYSKGREPTQKAPSGKDVRGLVLKGLVAGLIVVGCACFFLFRSGKDDVPAQETPKKPKVTKRHSAPARPPKAPEQEAKAEDASKSVDPNARPTKVGEIVNGYVMLPSGRIHKPTGVVTNRVAEYGKSKYSIFENRSDNDDYI